MVLLTGMSVSPLLSAEEGPIEQVELQPLVSATERLLEALQYVGAPLKPDDESALRKLLKEVDAKAVTQGVQKILDPYVLTVVTINPESRVSVAEGPVAKELVQQGWRTFLVKVRNDAGVTAPLRPESPNTAPLYKRSTGSPAPKLEVTPSDVPQRFLDVVMFESQPLKKELSGLQLEYRIVQLYSRDVGRREARLGFHVGQ